MPQLNDTQFFVIILSIVFGYFGKSFFSMYLNSRLNQKTLDSNLEKEKQFLENLLKSKDKDFATLEKITSNSNDTLIKVLANFNNPKFNGEEIDALSIKNIKNKEKRIKREIIDGEFKIKSIDTKEDDIEILKLKILNNEDTDEESKYLLAIAYLDSLTTDKEAIGSLIGKAITSKKSLKLKVLYIYKNDIIDDVQIIQFSDLTN